MKRNRLVSRLPFFVFNCQGSRHHPADYADKVLLAESHRHRVYGVGLRFGLDGHLRQVLRPNTGKAFGDTQRPVHAVNGFYHLPGKASGLPGVIKAADVGLHRMGQGVQAGLRRDAVEAAPGREPLRHGNKFRCGALAAACHDHGLFAPGVRQQLRQPLQAPGSGDAFRSAPGQYPGLQAEAGLKHPTVYFLSSIMRTSFPWTITPHFRRDCKTEWGHGYCRGGRLCPSSAITQHFVGQGPCAPPGVGGPGSGVRAPRPTHHLPIESHKGRRPPTVVPTDSRPLSCPLIGALSRIRYPIIWDTLYFGRMLISIWMCSFFTLTRRLFLVYFAPRHRLFSPRQSRGLSLMTNTRRRPSAMPGAFFTVSVCG